MSVPVVALPAWRYDSAEGATPAASMAPSKDTDEELFFLWGVFLGGGASAPQLVFSTT